LIVAAITWPVCILVPASVSFEPLARSRSGGPSLSGSEQVVTSGAGIWTATLGDINIRNATQIRLWRAIAGALEGMAGTVLIPIYDGSRAPTTQQADPLPHSDDSLFSDGSGYAGNTVVATVAPAALRATQLTITVGSGHEIKAGQHFSIGQRCYRIVRVTATGTPGVSTVKVWPPLREAVSTATLANFDQPVCLMRLAQDDGMALSLDLWRLGRPSVSFVEAI
jgi:hypothetical protein